MYDSQYNACICQARNSDQKGTWPDLTASLVRSATCESRLECSAVHCSCSALHLMIEHVDTITFCVCQAFDEEGRNTIRPGGGTRTQICWRCASHWPTDGPTVLAVPTAHSHLVQRIKLPDGQGSIAIACTCTTWHGHCTRRAAVCARRSQKGLDPRPATVSHIRCTQCVATCSSLLAVHLCAATHTCTTPACSMAARCLVWT